MSIEGSLQSESNVNNQLGDSNVHVRSDTGQGRTSIYLLPSGCEEHEVLRVESISIGILLYCRQSSKSFSHWLNTCPYIKQKLAGNKRIATCLLVSCVRRFLE